MATILNLTAAAGLWTSIALLLCGAALTLKQLVATEHPPEAAR
jgi:hypothetical protein